MPALVSVTVVACSIIERCFSLNLALRSFIRSVSVAGARAVPSMFRGLIDGMFGWLTSVKRPPPSFLGTFGRFGGQIGDQRSTHQLIIVILIAAAVLVLSKPSYALLVFIAGGSLSPLRIRRARVLPVYFVILVLGIARSCASSGASREAAPARSAI